MIADGLRARLITRARGGHDQDQRDGAAVDERQQILTDRASITHINVLRKPHDRLAADPFHQVTTLKHASN